MRQTDTHGGHKKFPKMIGGKFVRLQSLTAQAISDYISKKGRFSAVRWLVLLLGILVALTVLAHVANYLAVGLFLGTSFGAEWIAPSWNSLRLSLLVFFHGILAAAVVFVCSGFFTFKPKIRLKALTVIALGLLIETIRIVCEVPLLTGDWISRSIFIFEFSSFAIFLAAGILLNSREVRMNFDSIGQKITDYRDGKIAPYDVYDGNK
jgi:hypothetical protein